MFKIFNRGISIFTNGFSALKVNGTEVIDKDGNIVANITAPAGSIGTAELAALAVTAAKLAADAVETAKIKDANVTLAKLAAGITPSHVVKFAGTFTTAGGDAAEQASVAGVLATDIVQATLKTEGASPVTLDAAAAGTDVINFTMSADPSTDHVIQYTVFRAAA